ncbi:MAG: phosphoribosylanthranilate isomerase [Muribaculum sp.]|nr:phosphoribosylanthranilate isomerase [Muribaculum sp.]
MQIKICGLTDVREAEYLNQNRVDYAGIVLFYEKSRRNMEIGAAERILEALSPAIGRVAVMVSPTAEQVRQAADAGFNYVQIHGELRPQAAKILPVWKAFHVAEQERFSEYRNRPEIAGYVFDAQEPGSGRCFDWEPLKNLPRDGKRLILAGGLRPENVAEAIARVRPDVVDVSSGVEAPGGGKDAALIEAFVKQARGCRMQGTSPEETRPL